MNTNTRKFKDLTHQEKCEIYNMVESGHYYIKEISAKFNVSNATIYRVHYAVKDFLRTGTPKDL